MYKIHQEKLEKLERIQNDSKKLKEFDESKKFSFKPTMTANMYFYFNIFSKTFEKSLNVEKPKGFDQTVERIRNGIVEKYKKKYLLEKLNLN